MIENENPSGQVHSEEQRFGNLAVSLGFITPEQLSECLQEQAKLRQSGDFFRIGQILMKREFLSTEQFLKIMSEQETRYGETEDRQAKVLGEILHSRDRSSDDALGPGKVLGRYKIIRQIGRGGMGIVYEAVDSVLKRKVALKVLREDMVDAAIAKRLEREALTAARLKHPHIVTLYESGVIEGVRFLAMELVQGASLRDWLVAGNISLERKVEILEEVARAVDYAHSRGVVHRDLKPGNIMLDEEARPMIMDFGLARLLDDVTNMSRKGAMVGTPGYMAPEQITGSGSVDGRTDIYALGVMMYELLASRMPFDGTSAPEICRKIIETDPLPIAGLSRELEAIRCKAMARDRVGRYTTAGELADELRRYREGEPVLVCPPTLFQSIRRTFRRHRVASTAIAALFLAGLLGTGFFFWFEDQQKKSRAGELFQKAEDADRSCQEIQGRLEVLEASIQVAEAGLLPGSPEEKRAEIRKMKEERKSLHSELLQTITRIPGYYVAALAYDEDAGDKLLEFQTKRLSVFFVWWEAVQRKSRAEELLVKAADAGLDYEKVRLRLSELETAVRKAEAKLMPLSSKEEKEAFWKLEGERKDLQSELYRMEARIIGFHVAALAYDEDAARDLLEFQWKLLLQAQSDGNQSSVEKYQESIRQMAKDRNLVEWIQRLDSGGREELDSTPRADSADLYRFEENEFGLRDPVEVERGLFLPCRKDTMKPGSYLFVLHKKGFSDVRLPVRVGLGTEWKSNVRLLTAKQVGEGFVYIPGGPFISGDPAAHLSVPRRPSVFVPGFLIGRYEVTRAEYREFLNDLVRTGRHNLAHFHLSKEVIENGKSYPQIFKHDHQAESDFYIIDGVDPMAPITSIRWDSANAYALWLSKKRGEEYRLPEGLEWEKAGRGVDGRSFPWGELFDWSFMNGYYTREVFGLKAVGSYPKDCSPYGLFDMAGNASEWTQDLFHLREKKDREGLCHGASGGRTIEPQFHVSSRFPQVRLSRPKWVGFRLVKEIPPQE